MFDRWHLSLLLGLAVFLAGSLLLLLLASGFTNPPRAGTLTWQTSSDADWQTYPTDSISTFYVAPTSIKSPSVTLELTATNRGDPESAWGIWLETEQGLWLALLNREGYFSIGECCMGTMHHAPSNLKLDWREFLHIHPQTKLYLNVEADASSILRFNDEIAWTGNLSLVLDGQWGTIYYRNPRLTWRAIQIYTQH